MMRIRISLAVTLTGTMLQFAGLAVDAWLHGRDPDLASREAVLTLANPGHALFAVGLALVVAGACLGWMGVSLGASPGRMRRLTSSVAAPVIVLVLAGASFTFAYSTGSLTGDHEVISQHAPTIAASSSGDVHADIDDTAAGDIDESRRIHGAEVAISQEELNRLVGELDTARRATEKYEDIQMARSAGYMQVTQDLPGIAAHFISFRAGSNGAFDPTRPQILLYTKQSGEWEFVGVAYTSSVLTTGGDAGPPPDGFSGALDTWHYHDNLCFLQGPRVFVSDSLSCVDQGGLHVERTPWMLHVWLYDEAPEGIFAHANSRLVWSEN